MARRRSWPLADPQGVKAARIEAAMESQRPPQVWRVGLGDGLMLVGSVALALVALLIVTAALIVTARWAWGTLFGV